MEANEQKQQLSVASLHAVASAAGFVCQTPDVDDDSIDCTVMACGWLRAKSVLRSPTKDTDMNRPFRLPKERLLTLDPADVESYLVARGWKPDRKASSAAAGVYHLPADPEAEILMPRDRGFVDYALRLGEVVQALASAEKRTAWEVLEELTAPRTSSSQNGPAPGKRPAPP
jgi:hypothetical protein